MKYTLFDSSTKRVLYIFIMLMIGLYFIRQKESLGTYFDYEQN